MEKMRMDAKGTGRPEDGASDTLAIKLSRMRCSLAKKRASEPDAMPNGTAPFGYLFSQDTEQRSYIADPLIAPYVRMVFKWYLCGVSCREIADRLALLGVPTPGQLRSGKAADPSRWEAHSVLKILQNPNYTGDVYLRRMQQSLYQDQPRRKTSSDEWIVRRNAHEPLVTREDYEEVKRRLSDNCRRPDQKKTDE